MSKTLEQIARQLKDTDKKVQLIYAFNGTGKTRLSLALKKLISPKLQDVEDVLEVENVFDIGETRKRFLYYNAFTEDLFYWDNDLEADTKPKLKIQPNSFTDWLIKLLKDLGQDQNIASNFQRYSSNRITPAFNEQYIYKSKNKDEQEIEITVPALSEVSFSMPGGFSKEFSEEFDIGVENIKISKGEESNFIWSIFYTLLDQIITILNEPEAANRETDQFDQLEYVFIDDPVSSLDENHLIELAVNLAELIKSAPPILKFVITTHNPLFYNVLYNEVNTKKCYLLDRFEDGTFDLFAKDGDSNKSFSYHLYLKKTLEKAIADNRIEKFHFTLLRNLYEKTASFLGYTKWQDLLDTAPGDKDAYLKRIVTFSSHRTLSSEEVAEPTEPEKQTVKLLLDNLLNNYGYWKLREENKEKLISKAEYDRRIKLDVSDPDYINSSLDHWKYK